ncbi:unnamed protein product [Adineta steineri]|uniref:Uncharacterized protein n=1 Tax=Adineta steineri TaxID=433720 RepID=A0A815HZF7_9BILA|nr:unnamed protein product [Adineta steineri]CAF1360571.1 unnamed protein product [Adineta steineri]CAF3696359.1 unnamed protein product [Adineta steineri]CAF4016723.1 unnamed protein product [Adineta steineri]
MDSDTSNKITSTQEASKETKQDVIIVIIDQDGNKQLVTECIESLQKECGQHHMERCASFDIASSYIKQLDENKTIIVIIVGRSYEKLQHVISNIDSLPGRVRNCFIYSTEHENADKPTNISTQYIFGKRQLLSAIHDVFDALDSSPIHVHPDEYTSITVHESTFNKLFKAMKSIHIKVLGFTIKISEMEAILSPSIFQFKALAELIGILDMLPHIKQKVHGECELALDEHTGKLLLKIKKLIIELPKLFGFGGGSTDVGSYIPPIPLKGFINFTHPFDLPHMCETRQFMIIPRNSRFFVEDKRATLSVQIDYAETSNTDKK